MDIVGIVAEYNPFHNGHRHHIQHTRTAFPGCAIAAVMSGNFVQRGDCAVVSKQVRAAMAVDNGVDLVFELPVAYALSPAPIFARRGVALLAATGMLRALSFGSECGDIDTLAALARQQDGPEFQKAIRQGLSYNEACLAAVSPQEAALLRQPNNLLGVEYLRALAQYAPAATAFTLPRQGVPHDSRKETPEYLSASALRERLRTGAHVADWMPPSAHARLLAGVEAGDAPADLSRLDATVLALLRCATAQELQALPEVTEGLENRLLDVSRQETHVDALLEKLRTRRYSPARLRRILLTLLLRIDRSLQQTQPAYLRLLAASQTGLTCLRQMADTATLPLITKPAALRHFTGDGARLRDAEARADDLYALLTPTPAPGGGFYTTSPFIMPKV